MIAVDTSALMAVAFNEPTAPACMTAIENAETLLISAATLTETLIVSARRGANEAAVTLFRNFDFTIVPLTELRAQAAADAYRRWGKGFHSAALGYGDCFAYALAKEHDCPLLYIGNDFARTDVVSALG